MTTLALYLLAAMAAFYPTWNHSMYEESEVTEARYAALASDVALAVSQPYVRPLFVGKGGRAKTGLLLVSIAAYESRYKSDVMTCKVGGDHNKSWGPLQVQRSRARTCESSLGALGVALEMTWESFSVCQSLKQVDRLAEYTDGNNFKTERAAKRSELRMNQAMGYWEKHPFVGEGMAE